MDEQLSNLLLAQLSEPETPDLFAFAPISRRAFLVGGALAGAGLLSSCDGDRPRLKSIGKAIELSYGGRRWALDPDAFAAGASLHARRHGDGFSIALANARLAGMALRADLVAEIARDASGLWIVAIRAPCLALAGTMPLLEWLAGNELKAGASAAFIGPNLPHWIHGVDQISLRANEGLTLALRSGRGLKLLGSLPVTTQAIELTPRAWHGSGERLSRHLQSPHEQPVTAFAAALPALARRPPLRLPGTGNAARLQLLGLSRLSGEWFDGAATPQAAVLAEGSARLWQAGERRDETLALERGAVLLAAGEAALAGRIAGEQRISLGSVSARLAPAGGSILAQYRRGSLPSQSGVARLKQIWLPQVDGSVASLEFDDPVALPLGDAGPAVPETTGETPEKPLDPSDPLMDESQTPPPPGAETDPDLAPQGIRVAPARRMTELAANSDGERPFVGSGIIESIPLDQTRLSLRRGEDMLSLIFSFPGFDLSVSGDRVPQIKRRDMTGAARILVELPPQHLWETVHEKPLKCATPGEDSLARLAKPSRLAFIPRGGAWATRTLDFKSLLDWSDLDLAVSLRARAEFGIGIDAQLDFAGIGTEDALEQVFAKVRAAFVPPSDQETSLELAARLILSPSQHARWQQAERGAAKGVPLWNIRLDAVGRRSVRAIWSSYLQSQKFPHPDTAAGSADELYADPTNMLALKPRDHWGIVAQTSIYGLPALRSVAPAGSGEIGSAAKRVPRANVVRPVPERRYLTQADKLDCSTRPDPPACEKDQNSGIAIAYPFDDADITLTSLGAIMHARWQGEPPHWRPTPKENDLKPLLPREVHLEQLDYETWLGRDIRVVSVNKGFLFPLGIRAAFVTVSERRFYPDAQGNAVSYEVQRSFIRCRATPKRFPALNQPFDSRDFPAGTVVMQTLTTPDLADPAKVKAQDQIGTHLADIGGESARIEAEGAFWPQVITASGPRDFQFQWASATANGITSPLIFVANGHIDREERMSALARYYRDTTRVPERMRTANLHGARQLYAEEDQEGDARFDTSSWLLSVRGQLFGDDASEESFALDARMNGADQPPFYPAVERAQVLIQSVDRLVGKPAGLVTVGYYDQYVRTGFDEKNPSEIYLRVLEPRIAFDVQKRADVTGGASGPSTYVGALSRKIGIVGGKPSVKAAGEPGQSLNIDSAKAGKFNPTEFFGFAQGAKLLGILDFSKLIDIVDITNAPRLTESFGYGALQEAMPRVRHAGGVARTAAQVFFTTLTQLKAAADAELKRIDPTTTLKFKDLYPKLDHATADAGKDFDLILKQVENAASPDKLPDAASALVCATKPLLKEFDRLSRDPLPPAADDVLRSFQTAWQTLRDLTTAPRDSLLKPLLRLAADAFADSLCALLASDPRFSRLLFGARGVDCEALKRNPADLLSARAEALFRDSLAVPLATLFAELDRHRAIVLGQFMLAETAVREAAARAIEQGLLLIASRLADLDPAVRDIRDAQVQAEAARALAAALAKSLDATFAKLDPKTALDRVTDSFLTEAEKVITGELLKLKPFIHPRPGEPNSADALLGDISVYVRAKIGETLRSVLGGSIAQLRDAITAQAGASKAALLQTVTASVAHLLDAMLASAEFSRIAQFGHTLTGWCDQGIALVQGLGNGLSAPVAVIEQLRTTLSSDLAALTVDPKWPAPVKQRVQELKAHLLTLLQAMQGPLAKLAAERARLAGVAGTCTSITTALDPLQEILLARTEAIRWLEEVAADLVDMPKEAAAAAAPLLAGCGQLVRDISSIARLTDSDPVVVATRQLVAALPADDPYRKDLDALLLATIAEAAKLDTLLKAPSTAAALKGAITDARAYASDLEWRLAELLLQSLALEPSAATAMRAAGTSTLIAVAKPLSEFHGKLAKAFAQLDAVLSQQSVRAVLSFILGDAKLAELKTHIAAIQQDDAALRALAAGGTGDTVLKNALTVRARFGGTLALFAAISLVANLVEDFLAGNLGNTITKRLRDEIASFGARLRETIAQLVPTRVSTAYDWSTDIKDLDFFRMLPPDPGEPAKRHLTLRARASVDLATGKRDMSASGDLQPFELALIGELDMARIQFNAIHFESRGGEGPKFDVSVRKVVIGDLLRFIEALQAYMAPEGNGFYLTPIQSPLGIEAGYQFASSHIQVGSLSFLNVALCVAARLYFDQSPAEFIFRFASETRPFIISNPPYGGGGYAELIVRAGSPGATLTLSFMFGGAAALKFGPLNAQGRIMAGFGIRKHGDGTTLWALFEAVGEGSIACFSVSVALRVTVWHYADGQMHGETRYRFTFKVGFLKYGYGVTASYRIKGGKKQQQSHSMVLPNSPLALACAAQGFSWFHEVKATPKNQDWTAYRQQIDHSLL